MQRIGITGTELTWFRNYLKQRKQKTVINDVMSDELEVPIGLPQGTVLAPILFLIYINDIVNAIEGCEIRLFADDALMMISENNINTAIAKVQHELNNLYKWLCGNRLKLNINKTKYMILTRRNINEDDITELKINDEILQRVNSIKYLGIIIDSKLKFEDHINYTIEKVANKIGVMQRTTKFIQKKYKIILYKSIIEPHFVYCPSILFIISDKEVDKLQKLQNRCMRFILQKPKDTRTADMLKTLDWLSVKQKFSSTP